MGPSQPSCGVVSWCVCLCVCLCFNLETVLSQQSGAQQPCVGDAEIKGHEPGRCISWAGASGSVLDPWGRDHVQMLHELGGTLSRFLFVLMPGLSLFNLEKHLSKLLAFHR